MFQIRLGVRLFSVFGLACVIGIVLLASTPAAQSGRMLLVLNKTDATLAFVNPATNAVVATAATGDGPHEIVVSTDGKFAFVSNYGGGEAGNSLSMIDLAARKEVRRISVAPLSRPHGLAFHDGKLFFTSEANQVIGRYDPVADKVDAQYPTGQQTTHMVLIGADGQHLFTANIRGNTISIFDRAAGGGWTNATAVPVGRGPEGLDVSPDGRELWTAHSQDGAVSIIDVAKRTVVDTLDLKTKRSNRLKFTPDGAHVLISDLDAGELVIVDAHARKPLRRVALGRMIEGILLSPDGSKAYIAEAGDDAVAIVDVKTWAVTGRIKTGAGPDGMAWIR
jgi:YVTN family beta-propeller protein